MTDTLFSLSNVVILPAWLMLMVAPNSKWTARTTAFVVPLLLGLAYAGLLLAASFGTLEGGFMRLEDLAKVFANPYLALAGWVHYLAYDLFVGSWQVRDAARHGVPHVLVLPCLALTLFLGPAGLVCYLAVRWFHLHRFLCFKVSLAFVEYFQRTRLLVVLGCVLCATVLPLLLISTLDPNLVLGVNPWIRTAKFSISLGLYLLTLDWLMGYLSGPRWATQTIRWVTAGAVFFELPILCLQAARGVPSHFNESAPFDALMYNLMGSAAMTQMVMLAWVLVLFYTQQTALSRIFLNAIRAGIVLTLLAAVPGLMMVANGQHSIGNHDGGAGLPLVNWSNTAGDLRVAHFLCLHALQVLPLAGYCLASTKTPLTEGKASVVMTGITLIYALAIAFTMAQALAGQPFCRVG